MPASFMCRAFLFALLAATHALPVQNADANSAGVMKKTKAKKSGMLKTGTASATGLPKGIAASKKASMASSPSATTSATYKEYRTVLQDVICPTATGEDTESPQCKSHVIRQEMKKATTQEAKSLLMKRQADLWANTSTAFKAANAKKDLLYKKAFKKYCGRASKASSALCTDPHMIQSYGASAKIAPQARRLP